MPTKFPIDYEPGKVQAFLISKETGQMVEVNPQPWPCVDLSTITDDDTETEQEPLNVFKSTVTFKLPKMKETKRRKMLRALIGKPKLPRKLKKALKHLYVGFPHEKVEKAPVGHSTVALEPLGTKDGYPRTRWVRRAEKHIRKQFVVIEKTNSKQQ